MPHASAKSNMVAQNDDKLIKMPAVVTDAFSTALTASGCHSFMMSRRLVCGSATKSRSSIHPQSFPRFDFK